MKTKGLLHFPFEKGTLGQKQRSLVPEAELLFPVCLCTAKNGGEAGVGAWLGASRVSVCPQDYSGLVIEGSGEHWHSHVIEDEQDWRKANEATGDLGIGPGYLTAPQVCGNKEWIRVNNIH